jgi:hypothetical protein
VGLVIQVIGIFWLNFYDFHVRDRLPDRRMPSFNVVSHQETNLGESREQAAENRRAIVAELNEFGMEASESAKPGQQVIIYRLRPLLLSPVAAAWKQVKPPQVRQCASHEGQAVSEHLENPVPLAADVERRQFDAASLEAP